MASGCRVAIYSQDSLGLGHLRRNILIGGAILEARKDSNVLLLADSPVAPFFQLPSRMDHIKLPSICKVSAGCWEATRLRIDERELSRLRSNLLRDALLDFQPDLLFGFRSVAMSLFQRGEAVTGSSSCERTFKPSAF